MREKLVPLHVTVPQAELEAGDRDINLVVNHTLGVVRVYVNQICCLTARTSSNIIIDERKHADQPKS